MWPETVPLPANGSVYHHSLSKETFVRATDSYDDQKYCSSCTWMSTGHSGLGMFVKLHLGLCKRILVSCCILVKRVTREFLEVSTGRTLATQLSMVLPARHAQYNRSLLFSHFWACYALSTCRVGVIFAHFSCFVHTPSLPLRRAQRASAWEATIPPTHGSVAGLTGSNL